MKWFNELLYSEANSIGYAQRFEVDQVLHESRSKHQHLLLFENSYFGRILVIDGVVQTTERDEFAYHEMLAHVPIFAHGAVSNVLIIGGGDGGIDEKVIELCAKHLPKISDGAFDDHRTTLVIDNGLSYLEKNKSIYDVIIVDSTDPLGPGEALFKEQFYDSCHTCLSNKGILVTQNGVPFTQEKELANSHSRLKGIFKDTTFYLTVVPTYVGGFMALGWASDCEGHRRVSSGDLATRFNESGITTSYYNPAVHQASFVLPPFISRMIQ